MQKHPENLTPNQIPREYYEAPDYTSSVVLADPSWADPEDPKLVNFSAPERASIQGKWAIDNEGRPVNPSGRPGMSRGRGELGKWGVNKAEECLVVARDADGKRYILLSKRTDTGQWSLAGGMDEGSGSTARRELLEETGIDAPNVSSFSIYKMYADDYRNTWNACIETKGVLFLPGIRPQARTDGDGGKEILKNKWFELTNSIEDLLQQTGPLFASHEDGIRHLLQNQGAIFSDTMRWAQAAHGRGEFEEARRLYRGASGMLLDPSETGRALRGEASSIHRLGNSSEAQEKAQEALSMHTTVLEDSSSNQERVKALRERGQSLTVLGQIAMSGIVKAERNGDLTTFQARSAAQQPLNCFEEALAEIRTAGIIAAGLSGEKPVTDQYTINLLSRLAMSHSLYGDPWRARNDSHEAVRLGWQSESKHLPTRANISSAYALRARGKAVLRGLSAVAVNKLATPWPSLGRKAAIALASTKRFGF